MGWKTFVVIIFLAFAVRRFWQLMIVMQPWKVVYNHSPGPCRLVPPIVNGSEDIQLLPNGKALITSGIKFPSMETVHRIMNSKGQIYFFDFNSPEEDTTSVSCDNFPDYGTTNFGPHGLSILQHNGMVLVFVVNHRPQNNWEKDTIEKFSYDMMTNTLTHLKTYSGDYFRLMNDIVAVGPESFYITNSCYGKVGLPMVAEAYLLNLNWASVVYYENGKGQIVADDVQMANGINISPDKKFLYMCTSTAGGIHVYAVNNDGSLEAKQFKPLPTIACDNIDVDTTGDLWLGCHPVPVKLASQEKHAKPSQVLRIKTENGLLTDITEIYSNDGSEHEASSVAVYHKKTAGMLIGSVDSELLYCKVNYLA